MTGFRLIVAVLCVLANGFFVAAEFGLVKVRTSQLIPRAKKGDRRATLALKMLGQLDVYLSACQLGITLASLGLGWVGEPLVASALEPLATYLGIDPTPAIHGVSLTLAFGVITTVHIVVGEQAPKLHAIGHAEKVAMMVAVPLRMFFFASYPFLVVLNSMSNGVVRALGFRPRSASELSLSAEEIRVIVSGGKIEPQKRAIIERVMIGFDRPVRAVMTPRVEMSTLSMLDQPDVMMQVARVSGYSRLPLIEGHDPDKVLGYVYVKDLLVHEGIRASGISSLRRDILFVPETRKLGDVLTDFQNSRTPVAIVVDEYGGTSGLVTLEDVLEQIVGEVQDEFDAERPQINECADGSILVDGLVAITELATVGVHATPVEGHETVGGYVVSQLGRLARPKDVVTLGEYDAIVEQVRRRRVSAVRLVRRVTTPTIPPGKVSSKAPGA